MLWFYSSHDKKLRYSELSFNQFRRTYMSILRGMTKPKDDGSDPDLPKEACSFVSFRYDSKLGCGVLILRNTDHMDELKNVALTVTTTNDATGKITCYRGWSADEEVEPAKPAEEDLVLFRIDFWAFPQGASEEEIKMHLKEDYFDEHELEEKKDWTFVKAYSAPYKPKPHIEVFKISKRFMDLLSKKQWDYAQATGIGKYDYFKNPYQLELLGFGSAIYAEPASLNPYTGNYAPNDCLSFLDRLVTTHTDKQIAIPTIESGNITISSASTAQKAETYGSYKRGKDQPPAKKAKTNNYAEHPDRAAKKDARLKRQVKVRVPVFSSNPSIKEVQQRQMNLVVATVVKQINEVHKNLNHKNHILTNAFTGSNQAGDCLPGAEGRGDRHRQHQPADRDRLDEMPRHATLDFKSVLNCKTFKTEAEKYITVPYIIKTESLSQNSHLRDSAPLGNNLSSSAKGHFSVLKLQNRFSPLTSASSKVISPGKQYMCQGKRFNTLRFKTKTNNTKRVTSSCGKESNTAPSRGMSTPMDDLNLNQSGHSDKVRPCDGMRLPPVTRRTGRKTPITADNDIHCAKTKRKTGHTRVMGAQPFTNATKSTRKAEVEITKPRFQRLHFMLAQRLESLCKPDGLQSYTYKKKIAFNSLIVRRKDHRAPAKRPVLPCNNPLKLSDERPETFFARLKS